MTPVAISEPVSTQRKAPILPLTSVRIFAALYVVLLHSFLWTTGFNVTTWFGRFIRNGYTAVGFFFTLSGFILAHVYLNTDRPLNRRAFWTSRFARAYPLLFASLLFAAPYDFILRRALLGPWNGLVGTGVTLAGESLLLQAWFAPYEQINGPSWSLSAEAFFYLLFPFVAVWIWRCKRAAAAGLFLLFWGCTMVVPIVVTAHNPDLFVEDPGSMLQLNIEVMPVFRMFEFFAGIALCALQYSAIANLSARLRNRVAWASLAGAMLLFFLVIEFANSIPLLVMSDGFLLPVYGLTILGLVNVRGWVERVFSHHWFVLMGEASYAVYLLHAPLFLYVSSVHKFDSPGMWVVYLGLVLGLSLASFVWLERPARKKILAWASIRPAVTLQQEMVSPAS